MILILVPRKKMTPLKKNKNSRLVYIFICTLNCQQPFPPLLLRGEGTLADTNNRSLTRRSRRPRRPVSVVQILLPNSNPLTQPNPVWTLGAGGLPSCEDTLVVGEEPVSSMSTSCPRDSTGLEGNHSHVHRGPWSFLRDEPPAFLPEGPLQGL